MNLSSRFHQMKRFASTLLFAGALAVCGVAQGGPLVNATPRATVDDKSALGKMGVEQKLGDKLPMDLIFKNEEGQSVPLGTYFGKRPVLLIPMFYNCQTGCAVITDAVLKTLAKGTKFDQLIVGKDLDVLMYSIHPKEGPELAKSKKALIMRAYERPGASESWHLLTSDEATARKLSASIGFTYNYDERRNLVNHPVCTVIITPDGRVSSYTMGQTFPTKVIETALGVAQKNEIGEKADQSMMFGCIMVDPATGQRTLNIERVVRIFMGLTLVFVAGWLAYLSKKHPTKPYTSIDGQKPAAPKVAP